MTVVNGYATRDELKDWMRSTVDTAAENTKRDRGINAASRAIDHHCDRHFFQTAGSRHFDVCDRLALDLEIGDVVTVTAVKTDDNNDGTYETTWDAADYQLLPLDNADPYTGELRPRDTIRSLGSRSWPISLERDRRGLIEVTAVWGWASVPEAVKQACLILATRLVKRAESPEGIAGGFDEFGAVRISSKDDPDAMRLLYPYRRMSAVMGIA